MKEIVITAIVCATILGAIGIYAYLEYQKEIGTHTRRANENFNEILTEFHIVKNILCDVSEQLAQLRKTISLCQEKEKTMTN